MKINCNPPYNVKYTCSVTNLMDNCDNKVNRFTYVFKLTLLHIFILFSLISCGAKKKSLDIVKTETKEKKDLEVFESRKVNLNIDFFSDMSTYKFTPIDPKRPIMINDSIKIDNAIVEVTKKKVDSTVQVTVHDTVHESDKGEVYSSRKEKKMEKEKEGNKSVGLIWGLAFLLFLIVIGKWKKWF